jgi:DNA-binding response OmpR family regulator
VMTGYARSLKEGAVDAYDCLFKPFRPAELLKRLRNTLAERGEIVPFPKP